MWFLQAAGNSERHEREQAGSRSSAQPPSPSGMVRSLCAVIVCGSAALADPPITECVLYTQGIGYGDCTQCEGETHGWENCSFQMTTMSRTCAGPCEIGAECEVTSWANQWSYKTYECISNCGDPLYDCDRGSLIDQGWEEQPSVCGDCVLG